MPVLAHERASRSVATPDDTPDVCGHVPRARRATSLARKVGRGALAALELVEQRIQRSVEHLGEIARGHGATQQRLRAAQLVVRRSRNGDLQREALGRERGERRVPGKWSHRGCQTPLA